MAQLYNNFQFLGKLKLPSEESKNPFHVTIESKNNPNWKGEKVNFMIQAEESNTQFLELMGSKSDVIKTWDKERNKFDVLWDDRFDKEILKMIPNWRKISINLGKGEKLFLTEYDAVMYLIENLPNYEGELVVTGDFDVSIHRGTVYKRFIPSKISVPKYESEKGYMRGTILVYFTKDSLNDDRLTEEKKVDIDGYIRSYDRNTKSQIYPAVTFTLDGSKVKDESSKALFMSNLSKFDVPKGVYSGYFNVEFYRGTVLAKPTEDDFTKEELEHMKETGKSFQEFMRERGDKMMAGNVINEIHLINVHGKQISIVKESDLDEDELGTPEGSREIEVNVADAMPGVMEEQVISGVDINTLFNGL